MTKEEKQLLLQDLCGRLPYGVIVQVNDGLKGTYDSQLVQVFCDRASCSVSVYNPLKECICIDSVKPYLRPMSSMTEEEYDQLYIDSRVKEDSVDILDALENDMDAIQWLLKNHFDFMGLIPKGLAITVTEENNPYEN